MVDEAQASNSHEHVRPIAFAEAATVGGGDRLPVAMQALHGVKVQLQVRVGQVRMTVRDLLDARTDAVLQLDRGVDEPVDLLIEGKVVARGHLVAVDGKFGVQISELPLAMSR